MPCYWNSAPALPPKKHFRSVNWQKTIIKILRQIYLSSLCDEDAGSYILLVMSSTGNLGNVALAVGMSEDWS